MSDKRSEQFTQFYYNTFDEGRQNLAALYVSNLLACFRNQELTSRIARPVHAHLRDSCGPRRYWNNREAYGIHLRHTGPLIWVILTNIIDWQSLPFEKIVHRISTLDAQPSSEAGGILVMVTGALLVWRLISHPYQIDGELHADLNRLTKSNGR